MTFVQETNSHIVYPLHNKLYYTFANQPLDITSGGNIEPHYLPLATRTEELTLAWELVNDIENATMVGDANTLLASIQKTLSTFRQLQFDLGYIPQLQAHLLEDTSILFEWIFDDYRIGFNIDPNPRESGWFMLSNNNLGSINAYGLISGIDLDNQILWLLNFIISHS